MTPIWRYFGCWGTPGHYLYTPRRVALGYFNNGMPWANIDGGLCSGDGHPRVPSDQQIEGLALLHHKDGWTALSFWDRTGDKRHNSNSNFFTDQHLDFAAMVAGARVAFPELWARFTFEVRL